MTKKIRLARISQYQKSKLRGDDHSPRSARAGVQIMKDATEEAFSRIAQGLASGRYDGAVIILENGARFMLEPL